jgi:hypothetical protein
MLLARARALVAALAACLGSCNGSGSQGGGGQPADDTVALAQAIEASSDGRVILSDARTYVVRAVRVGRPGVTIACTGSPPATLKLRALERGDGASILEVAADRFSLEGCVLDGNRSAQPPGGFNDSFAGRAFRAGIRMEGFHTGLAVRGATFRNFHGAAIATRNVSDIQVVDSTFRDNNFEAVFADNVYPSGDPARFLDGFTFVGNEVANTRSRHASVNANGLLVHQMRNVRIEDNAVTGYERNAVKLENCRSAVVANNELRDGSVPNFAAITLQNGGRDVTVTGNRISEAGSGIDSSLVAGGQYRPDGLSGVLIRGNTIRSIRRGLLPDGIRVLGYGPAATDIEIADNVIEDVPRHAINVRQTDEYHPSPTFSRITIRGNRMRATGRCGDWFEGSAVAPTGVTLSANVCD